VMQCTKCGLSKTRTQVVKGLGPEKCQIMIVGRNPGYDEDKEGRPFVGGAGRVLNSLLRDAKIRRSECYVTNVCKCLTPANRPPAQAEIDACSTYLQEEMAKCQPNIIIALGSEALTALTGKAGITHWRGSLIGNTYKVMPTFHPSYIMRGNQKYWTTVVRDLERAKEASYDSVLRLTPTYYDTWAPEDGDPPGELFDPANPISFDIETPGTLKPWEGDIIGIAFGYGSGRSIHFDMRSPRDREQAKRILEGPAPKIVQRGTFDWYYLKYYDIETANMYFDTKTAAHLVCPILPNDLAYLTSVYTDIPYYKPYSGKSIGKMSRSELSDYNNSDADSTRRIMLPLKQELEENGQWELMQTQVKLIKVISKMQLRGVQLDLSVVKAEVKAIGEMIGKTEKIFWSQGINIRSGAQVGELLVSMGMNLKRTKGGKQYRTRKEDLESLTHPIIGRILHFRELDKLRSTFLEGMRSRMVGDRVHTTYSQTTTKTGRLSSSDPNLQNVPVRSRHIFRPDGGLFIEGDYSQFEVRIIAAVTGDEAMDQDLGDGVNIHENICMEVYDREEISPRELLRAKAVVFGTMYNRQPESIAKEFGISRAEAVKLQAVVTGKYPKILDFQASVTDKQVIQSAYGRYKYYDGNIAEMYNFPIQSAGSDTLLTSMAILDERLEKELPNAHLALTVHDNIVVDCSERDKDDVIVLMRESLERPIPELGGRIFPIKIKIGTNWRDMTKELTVTEAYDQLAKEEPWPR